MSPSRTVVSESRGQPAADLRSFLQDRPLPVAKTKREPGWDFPLQKKLSRRTTKISMSSAPRASGASLSSPYPCRTTKRRAGCLTLSSAAGAVLHFPVTLRNDSGAALHTKTIATELDRFRERISCPIGMRIQLFSYSTRISSGIPALSLPNII